MVVGIALKCLHSYQKDIATYIKLGIFRRT